MKKLSNILIVFAIFMVSFSLKAQEKPDPALLGGNFPQFKLVSNEGKQVSLSDYKGKKLMLVFPRGKVTDSYWCGICHYQYAEIAKLETEKKIREKYKVEILFVLPYIKDSVDKWVTDLPKSMITIEKYKNPEDPADEKKKNWAETIKKVCPGTILDKGGKYPFPFPILSDSDHALSTKLDLFREEWDGYKTAQNIPAIYILDETGVVKFKYLSQNTFDRAHAEYLLEFIKKMM